MIPGYSQNHVEEQLLFHWISRTFIPPGAMFIYEYAGHLQVLHEVKNRVIHAIIIIIVCLRTKYFLRIKRFIITKYKILTFIKFWNISFNINFRLMFLSKTVFTFLKSEKIKYLLQIFEKLNLKLQQFWRWCINEKHWVNRPKLLICKTWFQ